MTGDIKSNSKGREKGGKKVKDQKQQEKTVPEKVTDKER